MIVYPTGWYTKTPCASYQQWSKISRVQAQTRIHEGICVHPAKVMLEVKDNGQYSCCPVIHR